jgi:hypothetical protein
MGVYYLGFFQVWKYLVRKDQAKEAKKKLKRVASHSDIRINPEAKKEYASFKWTRAWSRFNILFIVSPSA